jgi:hypothetical protein
MQRLLIISDSENVEAPAQEMRFVQVADLVRYRSIPAKMVSASSRSPARATARES